FVERVNKEELVVKQFVSDFAPSKQF
ncbi:MAG: hypothetical protein ACJAS9_002005, partial [Polaribacter sp.]